MRVVHTFERYRRETTEAEDARSIGKCAPIIERLYIDLGSKAMEAAHLWAEGLTQSHPKELDALPEGLGWMTDTELQAVIFWFTKCRWFVETYERFQGWPNEEEASDKETDEETLERQPEEAPRKPAEAKPAEPLSIWVKPPFWEEAQGGPVTEELRRRQQVEDEKEKRKRAIEQNTESPYDLQALLFDLEYGEGSRRKHTDWWQQRREQLLRRLGELGFKPWPAPRRRPSPIDFSPDYNRAVARIGGGDGQGNRWVGHGNMPRSILWRKR